MNARTASAALTFPAVAFLLCSCGAPLTASRVHAFFRTKYGPEAQLGACQKVGHPTRGVGV